MKKICFFVLLVTVITGTVFAQFNAFEKCKFTSSSGNQLPYRLLRPINAEEGKRYPLIVFLHGAGDVGDNNNSQLANFPSCFLDSAQRIKNPSYVIAPQCPSDDSWSSFPGYPNSIRTSEYPTLPIQTLLALIDTLIKNTRPAIDTNRIYVTGFSLGGEGTFDIITRAPHRFAAAVPICGIADTSRAATIKHIPLWIFHGSDDNINSVEYSRAIVAVLRALNVTPKYTEYENANHYIWSTAYAEPDLIEWIFSQNKKNPILPVKKLRRSSKKDIGQSNDQPGSSPYRMSHPSNHPNVFLMNGKQLGTDIFFNSQKNSIPQSAVGTYLYADKNGGARQSVTVVDHHY